MMDLVSLGELLVDFTPAGMSPTGNPLFERNPGGGPANMACAAARLGVSAAMIGQVGEDAFGRALREVVAGQGVDVSRLRMSPDFQTTLAFVHLDERGDRSFSFYRRQGADTMLEAEPPDFDMAASCRYFFFSSVLMTGGPARETSFRLAAHARENGAVTVFDPNLRLNLWSSAEEARAQILRGLPLARIVKVSEEELAFLAGVEQMEGKEAFLAAARSLRDRYGIGVLLVTLGANGSFVLTGERSAYAPAPEVKTVDTTGAGDSFTGGFIARLIQTEADPERLDDEQLRDLLAFANATGSLTTTKKGGIPALPTRRQVEDLLAGR